MYILKGHTKGVKHFFFGYLAQYEHLWKFEVDRNIVSRWSRFQKKISIFVKITGRKPFDFYDFYYFFCLPNIYLSIKKNILI